MDTVDIVRSMPQTLKDRHASPMITYKSPAEIDAMREAGRAVAAALKAMQAAIVPGVTTTLDLDEVAVETLRANGAVSTLKGYHPPFSDFTYLHTTCISVNDEVAHGVPDVRRVLQDGDIVSLDLDAAVDGWIADAATTVAVGRIAPVAQNLLIGTREALMEAIKQARIGNTVGHISSAIQKTAQRHRYHVVRDLCGHGIGRTPHEEPDVFNYGRPGQGMKLKAGMTICIEPMINVGKSDVVHVNDDPWTIVTEDGTLSAHFEHTVAITEAGPVILTLE